MAPSGRACSSLLICIILHCMKQRPYPLGINSAELLEDWRIAATFLNPTAPAVECCHRDAWLSSHPSTLSEAPHPSSPTEFWEHQIKQLLSVSGTEYLEVPSALARCYISSIPKPEG